MGHPDTERRGRGGSRDADALGLFLWLLIATDAGYLALHLVHLTTPLLPDLRFSVERDGGLAELFLYIKEFWTALLLAVAWHRRRAFVYLPWMAIFLYVLADDALQIHELGGESVARNLSLQPIFGLRAQDLGELAVFAIVALPLLAAAYLAHRRANGAARQHSRDFACLLAALAVFAVVLDMLHSVMEMFPPPVRLAFGVFEDGGEMLILSIGCWYALSLAGPRGDEPVSLLGALRAWWQRGFRLPRPAAS